MNVYEQISAAISLGALLAVAASLWLLRNQVKVMSNQTWQLNKALEVSAESAIDTQFAVATQAYLDYPQLRPIFNERESRGPVHVADADTAYRASALAEILLDALERVLIFEERGLPELASALRAWIHDSLRDSSFLRVWLRQHGSWYSSKVHAMQQSFGRVPVVDRVVVNGCPNCSSFSQAELLIRHLPPPRECGVAQPLHFEAKAGVDIRAFALGASECQPLAEVSVSEVVKSTRLVEQVAVYVRHRANLVRAAAAIVSPVVAVVGRRLPAALIGLRWSERATVDAEVLLSGDVLVIGEVDRFIRIPNTFGKV